MAPVPAEIDLFTIPHSRMKELVTTYTQKVQCVDFRDCQETFNLLKELQTTLYEFKSHEWIENLFIMDQLKNRLKQRHIYNSAVCDCHNDNRLTKMLNLVRHGKHLQRSNIGERLNYGEELQKSFTEFVQQFLPHMEEEENIFQPLLVEHFEYDELRALKEVILEQHELIKDPLYQEKAELDLPETDSAIKDFRDLDSDIWSLANLYDETPEEEEAVTGSERFCQTSAECKGSFEPQENEEICPCEESFFYEPGSQFEEDSVTLLEGTTFNPPSEILIKIFSHLTPPDRGRCARVCSLWNELIYSSPLWKTIYPMQWARGIWVWSDANLSFALEDEAIRSSESEKGRFKYDEDADIDESEESPGNPFASEEFCVLDGLLAFVLPRIGSAVEKMVLDAGKGITSRQIRQALILCPNLTYLSAAYTSFDFYTLKGICMYRCLRKLRHLDLQGCVDVDDRCLCLLSECLRPLKRSRVKCPIRICGRYLQSSSPDHLSDPCNCCSSDHFEVENRNDRCCPFVERQQQQLLTTDSSDSEDFEIEELHKRRKRRKPEAPMEHLNFSGCFEITEQGLLDLFHTGLFEHLSYLNISSCSSISGRVLHSIVMQCRHLKPENLSYCNSILNGPYPSLANGCDSIYHPLKFCCQARLD